MNSSTRLNRLTGSLKSEGFDAVLVMSPTGTCYLSGCYLLTQTVIPEREAYVLITKDGAAGYIVCNIEEASARDHSWIEEITTYVEFEELPAQASSCPDSFRARTASSLSESPLTS